MSSQSVLLPGLKIARRRRGWTVPELADRTEIAIRTIRRYESPTQPTPADIDYAQTLADELGFPLEALMDLEFALGLESRFPDPLFLKERDVSARFAADEKDMEAVLRLRRMEFPDGTITPDETYLLCWERTNRLGIRIVNFCDRPIGFWCMFPIEKKCFDNFVSGEHYLAGANHEDFALTHANMLSRFSLPWEQRAISRSKVSLYLAGVVVPRASGDGNTNLFAGYVLLDMMNVGVEVFNRKSVEGICGYPSRHRGFDHLKNVSVEPSGNFVSGDHNHPICASYGSRLRETHLAIRTQVETSRPHIPFWEDRDEFVRALKVSS